MYPGCEAVAPPAPYALGRKLHPVGFIGAPGPVGLGHPVKGCLPIGLIGFHPQRLITSIMS